MKKIWILVLALMLALSGIGAMAINTNRTEYGSSNLRVSSELSVIISNYFAWVIPGDDTDMPYGEKTYWGDVGISKLATDGTAALDTTVKFYLASENAFTLVNAEKGQSVEYDLFVDDSTKPVEEYEMVSLSGLNSAEAIWAYQIFEANAENSFVKMRYLVNGAMPQILGVYEDNVAFYATIS